MSKVVECENLQDFISNVELKDIDSILDEADLSYRMHWACVENRINEKESPANLLEGVVYERRRALEWLISKGEEDDWDNISLDT